MDTNRLFASLSIAVLLLTAVGCAGSGSYRTKFAIPVEPETGTTMEKWFGGNLDAEQLEEKLGKKDKKGPRDDELFVAAEAAYWEGDAERAFDLYVQMLAEGPAYPLDRFAAARLYELRDRVVRYRQRIEERLGDASFDDYGAVARVYLSLVGQTVSYRNWRASDSREPFSADGLGFPTEWMATPQLSPWGEVDFDREFVEEDARIAETYRSPWFAEQRPVNRESRRPYRSGGLQLSPNFERGGIHYLETFVTVEPREEGETEARSYWMYGNFAAASEVTIDGKTIFERRVDEYGTGKRIRRVTLEPGTHRVRVKMAYEPGYRDWFDLVFLEDGAGPMGGSGVSFAKTPPEEFEVRPEEVEIFGKANKPSRLRLPMVAPDKVGEAPDVSLYLTAVAAHHARQPEMFEPAMEELISRYPDFAPAYGLRAEQVRTLWEMPSNKRKARAIEYLREARERDEESLRYVLELARQLEQRNSDAEEVRELLELARDTAYAQPSNGKGDEDNRGRLRNIQPLVEWADFLSGQGFKEAAEKAWKKVLEAESSNCRAARELEQRYAARRHYPPLDEITGAWKQCPRLVRNRATARPDRQKQRLEWYERRAERYPYRASAQIAYADELRAQGETERAAEVLEEARERMPWSNSLWDRLASRALADQGADEAVEILEEALAENGTSRLLLRRIASIQNDIPLDELVRDGRQAAMEHLAGRSGGEDEGGETQGGDEAYYLIDYAVRDYRPDGASQTLTHTVVRTMTKSAIDRFGETSIPGNAQLLVARTINQDGTTAVPDQTSGKSTLSMPDLDPGDFVEIAYLQNQGSPRASKTHVEGLQFFFKMSDISSLHSEYAIVGDRFGGEEGGKFIRQNDPPEPKAYEKAGHEGIHFLREDSPRPRSEPNTPGGREYLPWIQYYRNGLELSPFEVKRRAARNEVLGSLKTSEALEEQVEKWTDGLLSRSRKEVRKLFYRVAQRVTDPDADAFGQEAAHTYLSKSGSPHLLLQAVYEIARIPSELYLVKSKYRHPDEFPVGEFRKYRRPVLRVEVPGRQPVWLSPGHQDAMFDTVGVSMLGQPAVCVTCEESVTKTVPEDGPRRSHREIAVDGQLDEEGTLSGTLTLTVNGIRATSVRANLRQTTSPTRRMKLMDRVLNSVIDGSSLQDFEIRAEEKHDEPLVLEMQFQRPNWARVGSEGKMSVQRPLFREPVASGYAKLKERTRPLFVGAQRETDYELSVDLPEGTSAEVSSRTGKWSLDEKWGDFQRRVRLDEGTLEVDSSIRLPIQRISPEEYPAFREWAVSVERSSRLEVVVQ
jgi:tetratricopeptide (TPR) repeat protein